MNTLEKHRLETTDIFRGAFFLCKGGDLCRIRIKDNHVERDRRSRRSATFLFIGPDLQRHGSDTVISIKFIGECCP